MLLGSLVMVALTWGTVLKQDWPVAGLQLTQSIAVFLLLFFRDTAAFQWMRSQLVAMTRCLYSAW